MQRYRVGGGTASFGPGQLLGLTEAQFKSRAHQFDKKVERVEPKTPKHMPLIVAQASEHVQFKVGEVIHLAQLDKHLATMLEPLDPPQSDLDKRAAATASDRGGGKGAALSPELDKTITLIAETHKRKGVTVKQSEVVARIIKDRGLSLEQWNASGDDQRTALISEMVEIMRGELHVKQTR